tara:strand:- start:339 stop:935 length:597 start_codon:yes stop_codon:yes gene_type:complete
MPTLKNSLQVSEKLEKQILVDNQNHKKGLKSTARTIDMLIADGYQWFNMVSPKTKGEIIGVGEIKKNENSFVNPIDVDTFNKIKSIIARGLNPIYAYTLTRSRKTLTQAQYNQKVDLNRDVSGRLSDYRKQLINRANLLSGSNTQQVKKTFRQSFVLANNKMIAKLKGMEDSTLDTAKIISLLSQINVVVETKVSIKH